MEEVARTRPYDLEWLRTALPRRQGTEYLGMFQDNILYYPPIGSPTGHKVAVLDLLTRQNFKPNFADTDLTQSPDGVVSHGQALLAIERTRQIYWCNKKLYLAMMDTLLENYMHVTGIIKSRVSAKSRANVERQIGQNGANILKGIQRDTGILRGAYGQNYASGVGRWGSGYGKISDRPASQVKWLYDVVNRLSMNTAGCLMLMEDMSCTMGALVTALNGLYTEWQRDNSKEFPYEESSPQAMLFVKRCFIPPHDQPRVVFDSKSVISDVSVQDKQKVNYIRIEPTIGANNKFVVFEKENWLGYSRSEPPNTRSKILSVLVAYNFFDTARLWVETWGEPNPAPVTYNVVADPSKFADLTRLVPDLADIFNDHNINTTLTVAQTKRLVQDLTGNCPDFTASDDVHPMANTYPAKAKESVYKPPPGEGEVIGESEGGRAYGGGIAESEPDETRIAKDIEETYPSKVTTIPLTKEQKKEADKETDGNWMLLGLAALAVAAFHLR